MAGGLLLGGLASALVLVIAEFMTLYAVRVIRGSASVPPVAAGTENHYALIPIALLALVLVVAAIRLGDRWALVAVAVLGLIALLIGLLHDLPDARRTGLVGSLHTGWVRGASSPKVGMYMETLGAVLLMLTAGLGLLFGEPVAAEPAQAARKPEPAAPREETEATASVNPGANGTPPAESVVTKATSAATRKPAAKKAPAAKRPQAGGAKRASRSSPKASKQSQSDSAAVPRSSGSGSTRGRKKV